MSVALPKGAQRVHLGEQGGETVEEGVSVAVAPAEVPVGDEAAEDPSCVHRGSRVGPRSTVVLSPSPAVVEPTFSVTPCA